MKKKLTPKMEKFCLEYIIDFNATRAALAAGYSKKSAHSTGSENLKKPEIQKRIGELVKELNGEDPEDTIRKCIAELQMIAFGDYQDFVKWDEHGIEKFVPSKELKDGQSRLVSEISETRTATGGSRKLKLHDKRWAFEMLGKYYGFLKERVDHTSSDGSMKPIVNLMIPSNGREKKGD